MSARRPTAVLAAGLLLPFALTGCGVGRDPQTYRERPTVDAADASLGGLELRNVAVLPPTDGAAELAAGKDAMLTLSIINTGDAADKLTAVMSPAASSVELVDGKGDASTGVDVPAQGAIGAADFSVTLHGLTAAIRPGQNIPVTFVFRSGSQQRLDVPIRTYTSPAPSPSINVFAPTGGSGEG